MKKAVNLRLFSIGAAVAIIHFVTGLTIGLGNATYALQTTPVHIIALICQGNPWMTATVLIGTAILAMIPFFMPKATRGLLVACILPQQLLLVLSFASVVLSLISGHYPDEYIPVGGSTFIFIDQIWLMTIIFWHTMEYWTTLTWVSRNNDTQMDR